MGLPGTVGRVLSKAPESTRQTYHLEMLELCLCFSGDSAMGPELGYFWMLL